MNRSDILVPLNLDKHSFESLRVASRLAAELSFRVALLHVVDLNIFPFERRVYDELRLEYHQRLHVLAQCFFEHQPRLCVRVGKVHQEIVAEAIDSRVELILMGIPRRPRRRWSLGCNTVERVVRDAPCLTLALSNPAKIAPEKYRHTPSPFSYALGESELLHR